MKNLRKAWKELNRLLGRGKRKKTEVMRTGKGVTTDKQGMSSVCIFHLLLEMCQGTVMSLWPIRVRWLFHFKVAGKSFGGG